MPRKPSPVLDASTPSMRLSTASESHTTILLMLQIDGCHFHFCQAILRNVNQLGYKTEYEAITTDPATGAKIHSSVHTWVRRLMMLALVPTSDVSDVFNQLVENIPDTVQIDPLLGYFERTWIAGLNGRAARYPPAS